MELFSFLFGYLLIPTVFLFHRDWLLNNKYLKTNLVLIGLVTSIAVAFVSRSTGGHNFYLFLFCPLYSFGLLRAMAYMYMKVLGRLPRDTPKRLLDMAGDGMFADRIFNLVYFLLSTLVPLFFVIWQFTPKSPYGG